MKRAVPRKPAKRGRPRSQDVDRRWHRILEITAGVLLRDGYAAASIDKIAREGGVSKKTIYAKYKNKAALTEEVLKHLFAESCQRLASVAKDESRGLAAILLDFAMTAVEESCSPTGVELYRILVAENPNSKQLAKLYWNVRSDWDDPLAEVIKRFMSKGALRKGSPYLAARSLYVLTVADLREGALLGRTISKAEMRRTAKSAVERLMAAYAASKPA